MADEKKELKSTEEYVPHHVKVGEAKKQAQFNAKKNAELKRKINLTEKQIKAAEAIVKLMHNDDFKYYLECEAELQAESVMHAFKRRSAFQEKSSENQSIGISFAKTYGEDVSYNEGYQAGLFRFKNEREALIKVYFEYLNQIKEEGKNEN